MARAATPSRRHAFAAKVPRAKKRAYGETDASRTPLSLRTSGVDLDPDLSELVRKRMGFSLGKFARHIERVTVRFKDVNGPRGGTDSLCRIKVVLSGRASVVAEELARNPIEAFKRANQTVERSVRRELDRARARGAAPRRTAPSPRAPERAPLAAGRVRGARVDTALPSVSATDRRVGSGSTAARNYKKRTRKATAALEDSALDRPSRKSTRKSANRAKQGSKLGRRETRRVTSAKARAVRSSVRRSSARAADR